MEYIVLVGRVTGATAAIGPFADAAAAREFADVEQLPGAFLGIAPLGASVAEIPPLETLTIEEQT